MRVLALLLCIAFIWAIIKYALPLLNKYLNSPEISKQRELKQKLPEWERGLTFFLLLFFFVSSIYFSTPLFPTGGLSIFETIVFLLWLPTAVFSSALLTNVVLWIIPITRRTVNDTGLSFSKVNQPYLKTLKFALPILIVSFLLIHFFSL